MKFRLVSYFNNLHHTSYILHLLQKQLTKLKRIKVSLSTVADQKAKINVNDSTSNSNQYSNYYSRPESQTRGNSSPKMSKDDLIDEQLRKMKKDMGIM